MNTIARNLFAASLLLAPLAIGKEELPPAPPGPSTQVCGSLSMATHVLPAGTVLELRTWSDGEAGEAEFEELIGESEPTLECRVLLGLAIDTWGQWNTPFSGVQCASCQSPTACGKYVFVYGEFGLVDYDYEIHEDGSGHMTAEIQRNEVLTMACTPCPW